MAEHYFTSSPAGPGERRPLRVRLAGREVEVATAAGVFTPGGLDKGTEVLLDRVPPPPPDGTVLDLGCGWGPVALTAALLAPAATVWAVDVNERALDLTRENAAALGLTGLRPCRPEEVPAGTTFDAIWSNPPIRVGKAALHEMLLAWLPRLAPGGAAHLVVSRNLGSDSLQRWLARSLPAGLAVGRAASSKGFRVLTVTRAGD